MKSVCGPERIASRAKLQKQHDSGRVSAVPGPVNRAARLPPSVGARRGEPRRGRGSAYYRSGQNHMRLFPERRLVWLLGRRKSFNGKHECTVGSHLEKASSRPSSNSCHREQTHTLVCRVMRTVVTDEILMHSHMNTVTFGHFFL